MRVFCAIEFPADVRRKIAEYAGRLRGEMPEVSASWTRESNIHVTIKFLGEVSENQVTRLSQAAARAVTSISPFEIRVASTGVFPKRGSPRVLWMGIEDPTSNLDRLHASLERESGSEGFASEEKPFHPHLTLARIRRHERARGLAELSKTITFEPIELSVHELCVMRSELSSHGANHTVVSRHRFGG